MKKRLNHLLICPACLPKEFPLKPFVDESEGEDIISGYLYCGLCNRKYPIEDGIAVLLPGKPTKTTLSQKKYEDKYVVSSYLWSHYADIFHDPDANDAYRLWSSHISGRYDIALDSGCSVGRFTFELSKISDFAIGVDRSFSFIQTARKLLKEKRLDFSLVMEGDLTEQRSILLPKQWDSSKVEFIVADAQAFPFHRGSFNLLTSLNLLDKVSKPLVHLQEINRIAKKKKAVFLFSDPFSWSTDSAKKEDWLGGKDKGVYKGRGIENVGMLLMGKESIIYPEWRLEKRGSVSWKIRDHRNHFEIINSEFIVASR